MICVPLSQWAMCGWSRTFGISNRSFGMVVSFAGVGVYSANGAVVATFVRRCGIGVGCGGSGKGSGPSENV